MIATTRRAAARTIGRHQAAIYRPALRCLLMTRDNARLWTDRSCLQDVQYRTDANLAARQSIYACQRPRLDLPSRVLGLAALRGDETVADVGCGNGAYLAELARRRHAGPVLGVDLSAGMLQAARGRAPGASLVAGDAAALPLRDNASGVTLAMHMLYHVPEPAVAVRELRRITHPAGQVLVVLNGEDHLRELRDLITAALRNLTDAEPPLRERLRLDHGEDLLASEFTSITRHDFTGELLIPGPQPVEDYARSMVIIHDLPDPGAFATAVGQLVPTDDQGVFRVRTHSGCLVCS
jgi:SAM-dependent methyltransferase